MNDKIKESVSALMDGQADELEIRRLLNAPADEVQESWQRYLLISDVLKDEPCMDDLDISQGIRQALDGEPMDELVAPQASTADSQSANWMRWLSLGSSAAAVTLAVFMGLSLYEQNEAPANQPLVALQSNSLMQSSVSTVSQNNRVQTTDAVNEALMSQELRAAQSMLNEYLIQHVEDNAMHSVNGIKPLARSASFKQP